MFNEEYVKAYMEILKKDPEGYYEDYLHLQDQVNHSNAIYHGEPIPVTYQGLFYDDTTQEAWRRISEQLMQITRKITKAYVEDPAYRKHFKFSKALEELILVDPGYPVPVPICRYDVFYEDPTHFMFCEFNTDGASAMNEDNTIGPIMLSTKGMRELQASYEMENVDLIHAWAKTSLQMYETYRGGTNPVVAIVDILDLGTPHEFEEFRKAYEALGVRCFICDARELTYKDGKLSYQGETIDLVYRRIVTVEWMRHLDELSALTEAYRQGAYMMLGSLRSQIMHSKILYKVFRLPQTKALLTEEEWTFLQEHIPYTEEFATEEDLEKVLANKDRYILKPMDEYASKGVFAGREHDAEEWERILRSILGKEYIYQEYYDMKPLSFVEFDEDGSMHQRDFGAVVGLFIYNERFQAPYTRIGQQSLISGARKYYTAPNFRIRKKKED